MSSGTNLPYGVLLNLFGFVSGIGPESGWARTGGEWAVKAEEGMSTRRGRKTGAGRGLAHIT